MEILLVDDDEGLRNMITRYLVQKGHNVKSAQNGQRGWEIFFENPDTFDLIITDINMPILNGIELLTRIRKNNFDTSAIVISGNPESIKAEISKLNVLHLLPKPFKLNQLDSQIAPLA